MPGRRRMRPRFRHSHHFPAVADRRGARYKRGVEFGRFNSGIVAVAAAAGVASLLARAAFETPAIGQSTGLFVQIAALGVWWAVRYRAGRVFVRPDPAARHLRAEALLSIGVAVAAACFGDARIGGLDAFFLFAAGSLVLDAGAGIARRITSVETPFGDIVRLGLITWIKLVVVGAVLLGLPVATHPAVPDFTHNPWRHISACAFMSASAVSLCGATIYNTGEDLRLFGQAVLYVLMQAGGWLFIVMGMAALRPWTAGRISVRPVLATWMLLQAVAVAWSWQAWKPVPGGNGPDWWPAVFHAASAMNHCALALRQDGLASYLRIGPVYWPMLALSVIGGIGLPIVCERARSLLDRATRKGEKSALADRAGGFCSLELHTGIWILCIGAGLLWMMESPMVAGSLGSSRPVYLGVHQTTLADMGPADRWRAALLMSAEARSGGLHVAPLSEGALKWPTWALLILMMLTGGAVGSAAGGIRTGTCALLLPRGASSEILAGAARPALFIAFSLPLLMLLAALWLRLCQPEWSLWELGLHAASYVGGVGWSTGLTPHLTVPARVGIIVLMAAGKWVPVLAWCAMSAGSRAAVPARPARKTA